MQAEAKQKSPHLCIIIIIIPVYLWPGRCFFSFSNVVVSVVTGDKGTGY